MKIRCIDCGEYFNPSEEAIELKEDGCINPDSVNKCGDYWN
jgi:hypothetical protein